MNNLKEQLSKFVFPECSDEEHLKNESSFICIDERCIVKNQYLQILCDACLFDNLHEFKNHKVSPIKTVFQSLLSQTQIITQQEYQLQKQDFKFNLQDTGCNKELYQLVNKSLDKLQSLIELTQEKLKIFQNENNFLKTKLSNKFTYYESNILEIEKIISEFLEKKFNHGQFQNLIYDRLRPVINQYDDGNQTKQQMLIIKEFFTNSDLFETHVTLQQSFNDLTQINAKLKRQIITNQNVKNKFSEQYQEENLKLYENCVFLGQVNSQLEQNGIGIIIWLDEKGKYYQGQFKKGKIQGIGTIIWKSGSKFQGVCDNSIKNGEGIYTYTDGSVEIGDWKNDSREGPMIFKRKDLKLFYQEWKNNQKISEVQIKAY